MIANRCCTDYLNTSFVKLFRIKLNVIRYNNRSAVMAHQRIYSQSSHSSGNYQSNIAIGNSVNISGLFNRLDKFLTAHRDIKANRLSRFIEPPDVSFQFKYPAVVNSNTLKNPVAVKQTVVENRYFSIRLVNKFAVNPNFHLL